MVNDLNWSLKLDFSNNWIESSNLNRKSFVLILVQERRNSAFYCPRVPFDYLKHSSGV